MHVRQRFLEYARMITDRLEQGCPEHDGEFAGMTWTEAPNRDLFARPGWDDHVISLHSFSKDLAIPGYRVGAVAGGPGLVAEVMKLPDRVAICAWWSTTACSPRPGLGPNSSR